jgi:hypothetical protein
MDVQMLFPQSPQVESMFALDSTIQTEGVGIDTQM